MTKRDIAILLSPSLALVAIAVAAFLCAQVIQRLHDPDRERESDQKFERFVEKVEAGEWQLSQERMI